MSDTKLEDLCPGIQGAVKALWNRGWETSDSGDGSHFEEGMDGALPEPMIVVIPASGAGMLCASHLILDLFQMQGIDPRVEASYSPNDDSRLILITGKCLLNLGEKS